MQEKGGIAFSLDFSYVIFHCAFLFFPIDIELCTRYRVQLSDRACIELCISCCYYTFRLCGVNRGKLGWNAIEAGPSSHELLPGDPSPLNPTIVSNWLNFELIWSGDPSLVA